MPTYFGPRVEVKIRGTVDAVQSVTTKFGKEQLVITLVDAVTEYDDGAERAAETRPVYIPFEGEPGTTFTASFRKLLNIPTSEKPDADRLLGCQVEFGVRHKVIDIKGEAVTMSIHTLTAVDGGGAAAITDYTVLAYLNGKTPAEAMKGRSAFTGTPYAGVLASKAATEKYFGELVYLNDGRWHVKS